MTLSIETAERGGGVSSTLAARMCYEKCPARARVKLSKFHFRIFYHFREITAENRHTLLSTLYICMIAGDGTRCDLTDRDYRLDIMRIQSSKWIFKMALTNGLIGLTAGSCQWTTANARYVLGMLT